MDAVPAAIARCAVLARALHEPLEGTAPVAGRWLCVEQSGPWARDVSTHGDPILRTLATRATAAGWRLLLIRRPGRRTHPVPTVTVLLADTGPAQPRITRLDLPRSLLATVPLPGPGQPLPGEPVTEPLLLVCTHGRRDRCCALDGRALVAAVVAGSPELAPQVWESSHLGGHRFAPTALVLPSGYLYGRLDPATAVEVLKAAACGEMEPLLCRGRSTWTAEGQVAELAVRRTTGLRETAALHIEPAQPHEVLVTATDGRRWVVDIEHLPPAAPRPASCGADPSPAAVVRAGAVRAVGPDARLRVPDRG